MGIELVLEPDFQGLPVLTPEAFDSWWNELPDKARRKFVATGTHLKARFVCALYALNATEPFVYRRRGTEDGAFAIALPCPLGNVGQKHRMLLNQPDVQALIQAIRPLYEERLAKDNEEQLDALQRESGLAKPVRFSPEIAPREQAEHLNRPGERGAKPSRKRVSSATLEDVGVAPPFERPPLAKYLNRDLYTFAKDCLGYDLEIQPHAEMCEFLEEAVTHLKEGKETQDKRMLLVPRGSFKTTIGTIALPIYVLTWFPNAKILIDTYSHGYSKEQLSAIKYHLESNEKFRENFGDWVTNAPRWHETAITTNQRNVPLPSPSIDTAGVDKPRTGTHPDLIVCDDLTTERNVNSEQGRSKVRKHINLLKPILEPHGSQALIATRWSNLDVYGKLIKEDVEDVARGLQPTWKTLIRQAWLDDGSLYFPTRLNQNFLDAQKRELTEKEFSVFYLNQSIEDTAKIFKRAWMQYWDGIYSVDYAPYIQRKGEKERIPVYVTMAWDPAGRKPYEGSAYHGWTIIGADKNENWYILEAERMKATEIAEILDRVIFLIRRYQPRVVSIESIGGFGYVIDLLKAQMRKLELPAIPIYEYKIVGEKRSKLARIEAMQVRFKARQVWIRRGLSDLIHQLDEFPELDTFDIIDTLPQHNMVSRKPDPKALAPFVDAEDNFDAPENEPGGPTGNTWAGPMSVVVG